MNQSHCYHSDGQAPETVFLLVAERQDWKEQLRRDVAAIRAEFQHRGGITENAIADAVGRYREQAEVSGV